MSKRGARYRLAIRISGGVAREIFEFVYEMVEKITGGRLIKSTKETLAKILYIMREEFNLPYNEE